MIESSDRGKPFSPFTVMVVNQNAAQKEAQSVTMATKQTQKILTFTLPACVIDICAMYHELP